MQAIQGSVGDGGANAGSDVALVQAMLLKIEPPSGGGTYLASYDGACGPGTLAAIRRFRTDQKLEAPHGAAAVGALIQPNDATWTRLAAQVPENFRGMRVLPAGKTVYLEATAQQRDARLTNAGTITFAPAFRVKVNKVINRMHALYGIAVGVCPQGGRRSFQEQQQLFTSGRGVTNAGPGESNHNFGMAVDMGFAGLRWLHSDGTVEDNEDPWLKQLTRVSAAQATVFWDALRAVGVSPEVGAFRGPAGDRPHLQNWSDAGVSMARSLAAHLTRSGSMHWEHGRGYQSDLGFGGALYPVGTASQIWGGAATIDAATLTRARAAARPRAVGAPAFDQQLAGRPQGPGAFGRQVAGPVSGHRPAPATQQDVAAMRQALRAEFERADQNWSAWQPQ